MRAKYKYPDYSIGKGSRFFEQSQITELKSNLPIYYGGNLLKYKKKSLNDIMGAGKKWTLKTDKSDETTPGPAYEYLNGTISHTSSMMSKKRDSTFGNYFDKYDPIIYPGQERVHVGRNG